MTKLISTSILVAFTLLLTPIDVLSETALGEEGPFAGNLKLGFAKLSGNVDMTSLNYGLVLSHKKGMNKVIFKVNGNETEVNDQTNQKDMKTSLLDIYSFNKTSAIYGKVSYLENEFIGYKYLTKLGGGYLHTFLDDGKKNFSSRIGYQARKFEEVRGYTDYQDFALVGFRGSYPVMENILMKTEVNYEVNFENKDDYESDAKLGFTFKVNKQVDLGIDYNIKYKNIPFIAVERTDRSITTNLIYKF